ncbi:MAG: hypothetical protein WCF85_21965 [Rhodospirillaceae bacterium]
MALPIRTPPQTRSERSDEAVDILRRLEPLLTRMDERMHKLEIEAAEVKGRISGLEGRMTGLEGQLRQIPTLWHLSGLIFAIFGAAFVLIRFAGGH